MTTHITTTAGQLSIAVHVAAYMGLSLETALTMTPDDLRARISSASRTAETPTPAQEPIDSLAALAALRKQLKQS